MSRYAHRLRGQTVANPGFAPDWQNIVAFRPDIVCVSHGGTYTSLEWMERAMKTGLPYVSVAQANSEYWWPDDEKAAIIRAAYEGAGRAYFVSNANLELFRKQIAAPLPNGEVIHNPFNLRWTAEAGWPTTHHVDDDLRLACVARLDTVAKGQDILLEALSSTE